MKTTLRPIAPEDSLFLQHLYGTTRERELNNTNLSESERADFVLQQFQLQHRYYHLHYAGADFDIILHGDLPIGRLYVHRKEKEIVLMDIALLPERQNEGLGTHFTRDLQQEATAGQLPIILHVEVNNPRAIQFYQRLGFEEVNHLSTHIKMEWQPPSDGT